ncbi:MAG TPA: phosphodiester glycosidase family protein [Polyangiaceae bacterium]|nr:phosphodiester glycosidase family protein [Polyangiaceae bacterium]
MSPISFRHAVFLPLFFGACRSQSAQKPDASAAARADGGFQRVADGVSFVRTERKDSEGRNTAWFIARVDLDRATPVVTEPPHARLDQLGSDAEVTLAINGGFFESDGSPSGLLASAGHSFAPWRKEGGSGVLVVSGDRAKIAPADEVRDAVGSDLAVQCGPRLVEPGGIVGIRSDDGKRAARTAVCVREHGRELDFVLAWTRNSDRDGPGLLELARWLTEPLAAGDAGGCEAALNLDGGPSTGVVVRGFPDELRKPFGRVPFALVTKD